MRYESIEDFIGEQLAPDRNLTWALVIKDMAEYADAQGWTDAQKFQGVLKFSQAVIEGVGNPKRIKALLTAGEITNARAVWDVYVDAWTAWDAAQDTADEAKFGGEWD